MPTPSPAQEALLARLHGIVVEVAGDAEVREVSAFGGRGLMVRDKMTVSARKDGSLLVRVSPSRSDELLALPGAHQSEMRPGRPMSAGWIVVDPDAIAEDDALRSWVEASLVYNRELQEGASA